MTHVIELDLGNGILRIEMQTRIKALRVRKDLKGLIAELKKRRLHGPPLTDEERQSIQAFVGWMIEQGSRDNAL